MDNQTNYVTKERLTVEAVVRESAGIRSEMPTVKAKYMFFSHKST